MVQKKYIVFWPMNRLFDMKLQEGKRIYFLSDFHLGVPDHATSLVREKKIVAFLEEIRHDAEMIFIVGDLFDFWFEYRKVVPKGYVRILGKLAQLTDAGIRIHFFVGNHDMWMNGYFEKELNIPVFHQPRQYVFNEKLFFIGHGDGLGPGDHGYKLLKKIFRNPIAQFLFGILPPVLGMSLAQVSSKGSRAATGSRDEQYLGDENEWLVQFCREELQRAHQDYFIFGHRHLPLDISLSDKSRYVNLGDWIRYDTYAVFDGQELYLKEYRP
jgi:UDP-2,3-diacylglucosamine hydrolase